MSETQQTHIGVEQLFRAHAQFVASFLHRMGLADADIEDAVQEVFMVAHKKGGYSAGPAKPTTWLAAIAVRIAAASRRSRVRLRTREQYDDIALQSAAATGASPEKALELRNSMWRVQRILDTLGHDHRAVFVLFELEGASCDEIATALDIPVGTVYSRLHTARRRFKKAHGELIAAEKSADKKALGGVA